MLFKKTNNYNTIRAAKAPKLNTNEIRFAQVGLHKYYFFFY